MHSPGLSRSFGLCRDELPFWTRQRSEDWQPQCFPLAKRPQIIWWPMKDLKATTSLFKAALSSGSPMRRWPAAWRDVHINYAETSIRVFARHSDGVGVADQTDMKKVVGLRQFETAFEVVRWDHGWRSWHVGSPLWGSSLAVFV